MTAGTDVRRRSGDIARTGSTVSRHSTPPQRWSRRRGVLSVFAAVACAGFIGAYVVPLTSVAAPAEAAQLDPTSLYASAIADAQIYNAGDTAVIALERDSDYSVYVTPSPTPPPPPASKTESAGTAASWAPPFVTPDPGTAQGIAYNMVTGRGWGDDEFACLVALWQKESGWRVNAYNAASGAYGIPQSTPGNKMASVGADWEINPATQITWGLGYISGRYGTPCGAWSMSQRSGWY